MSKKRILSIFLAVAMAVVITTFAACAKDSSSTKETEKTGFSYSDGISDDGYWEGITATDYVVLPEDYDAIPLTAEETTITEDEIDSEVTNVMSSFETSAEVTDRAVADGETVNIDYIGRVGGEAFDGGSTDGAGTDITIGETEYIDDFLQQLIGHKPGETFDIEVTFPDNYGVDELNGKDAVFETTINYISETVTPELTDAFVAENMSDTDGWNTVQEFRDGLEAELQQTAIQTACTNYVVANSTVDEVPDKILEYQRNALIDYYKGYAESYGVEFDEFLTTYAGVETEEELISNNEESNLENAKYSLIMQAVAEKQKLSCSDDDIAVYFAKNAPDVDVAEIEDEYGKPYVRQIIILQKATDFLTGKAVIAKA
jgi:trigger factor